MPCQCPTDTRAVRRCALGALIAAAYQITNDLSRAQLRSALCGHCMAAPNVNDVRGHAAVLALLDEVVTASC
jgi:hypothetical protein